jgi:hypothetical protein
MKTESQILTAIENEYRREWEAAREAAAFAANQGATREAKRLHNEAEAKREALNKFREVAMRAIYPKA